jgi:hypothetical protein
LVTRLNYVDMDGSAHIGIVYTEMKRYESYSTTGQRRRMRVRSEIMTTDHDAAEMLSLTAVPDNDRGRCSVVGLSHD